MPLTFCVSLLDLKNRMGAAESPGTVRLDCCICVSVSVLYMSCIICMNSCTCERSRACKTVCLHADMLVFILVPV